MTQPDGIPQSSVDDKKDSKWLLVVVGVLVVSALVAAVVLSPQSEDGAALASEYGVVTVEGTSLIPLPETGNDPAVGAAAPIVEGTDFAGEAVAAGGSDGTMQVLLIAAHWCPHCQVELPDVVDYLDVNGDPEGVTTVIIVSGTDPTRDNYPPSDWLAREGWDGLTIVDDEAGTAAQAYGLSGYPFWVVVDTDGYVVARVAGEVPVDQLYQAVIDLAGPSNQ